MSPQSTHMMLILPNDYKRIWKEKFEDVASKTLKIPTKKVEQLVPKTLFKRLSDIPALKFAEIRKSSGRVGEVRYRYLEDIGSITVTEEFTTQKRWYKCMVAYNQQGMSNGKPNVEFLYFFIDPWTLSRLMTMAERNKESNHLVSQD